MRTQSERPVALVLGAAGFIGRHVCQAFSRENWLVVGIGHGLLDAKTQSDWGLARWLQADIAVKPLVEVSAGLTLNAVVHCAGSGAVSSSFSKPHEDFDRSVASTASLLEFVHRHCNKQTRVVIASSAAVYGDQGEVDLLESATRNPISPYGFNKVSAEELCVAYSRFFGVKASVVRLFSVYGEGLRKQLLWDAMGKFSCGQAHFFGTGHELRDWIHVEDAARLLCSAARTEAQADYEVYNGGHEHATTRQVLATLGRYSYPSLPLEFSGQVHQGNPRRLTANCAYARRQLNWQAQIDLREGLARYAAWYKSTLSE